MAVVAALTALSAQAGRIVADFNDGWEFSRDEAEWRAVEVPHDWAIEGPFDPDADAVSGKLPWKGGGWYRKSLVLDDAPKNRRVFLDFDGVMCDGTAYVNGQPCGRQAYGYLGFRADATPYLYKGTNTIVVKADTTKLRARWYPGAGMYRRVRMIETDDLYLDERDVAITTPEVSEARATVRVRGAVTSRLPADASATVTALLKSPSGEVVAQGVAEVCVGRCDKGAFDIALVVEKPELWEMVSPAALYTTEVSVRCGGMEDAVSFKTGLRHFRFDAKEGFFLNGRHVQLKGVCLHADLGILGMAYNRSAMRRQLAAMRDMGANALRTSHNPPSPETLELCDEMGIFVWDECFDKWEATCGRGDEPLEEFVEARLSEFVRRDRNHPSVFVWSIGNEIPNGGGFSPGQEIWRMPRTVGTTAERCARFRNAVLAEDATRPVGIGSCFPKAATEGHYDSLDITGWNYRQLYDEMHRLHPEKPLVYSESASAFSEYGYYAPALPTNKTDYAVCDLCVDSYDRNSARWSDIPDREFERMERDRFVAGEFVWTGIDYLGEPSPYDKETVCGVPLAKARQARSSYFGIYDLLCFPKDRAFLYRSFWNKDAFTLHIVPDHWTFPGREGKSMPVYVYASADEAELFLNGKSLGRRRKDPAATMADGYYAGMPRYRLMWNDVAYEPGEIKAVAYGSGGEALGEESLHTAGPAAAVVLAPESDALPNDGETLVFVKVTLADADGTPVPRDNRRISFSVEGPGRIVSVGNSNPRGLDPFKAVSSHPLHNGRAGLALKRTGLGEIALAASSDGLAPATVRFKDPLRNQLRAFYPPDGQGDKMTPQDPRALESYKSIEADLTAWCAAHPGYDALDVRRECYLAMRRHFVPYMFTETPFYFESGVNGGWCGARPGRLVNKICSKFYKEMSLVPDEEFRVLKARNREALALCCGPFSDDMHHVPPFRTILKKGFGGVRAEVADALAKCPADDPHGRKQLETALVGLDTVREIQRRFQAAAEAMLARTDLTGRQRRWMKMAAEAARCCPWEPPRTFFEGLNTLWFTREILGYLDGTNQFSLGRPDEMLIDLYRADIAAGRITEVEARELAAHFLVLADCHYDGFKTLDRYTDHELEIPMSLGGCDKDGKTVWNELTEMFLDAHLGCNCVFPKLHCRVSSSSPEAYLRKIGELLVRNHSVFTLLNDDRYIRQYMDEGFSAEDARSYIGCGCWNGYIDSVMDVDGANYTSLIRILELTIHRNPALERELRVTLDPIDGAQSFEEVEETVYRNFIRFFRDVLATYTRYGRVNAKVFPHPVYSACLRGGIESRRDTTEGGVASRPRIITLGFIGNVVDSLCAIRKLCFEDRACTLDELLEAVRSNWSGRRGEELRRLAMSAPYWGDGGREAADMMSRWMERIHAEVDGLRNDQGGPYRLAIYAYREFMYWGLKTKATPDGRRDGDRLAQGFSPSEYRCKEGVTAVMNSIGMLPHETLYASNANLTFDRTAMDEPLMAAIIRVFAKKGSHMMQPNCNSVEELLDAQKHPELHQDIIVRVCGFSARFVSLSKRWQDEIIARHRLR